MQHQSLQQSLRQTIERFEFHTQIERLQKAGLLYRVTEKFVNVDLHPDVVTNVQMGLIFEALIRKFAELSNETAGEHFTPREVIRLMVNLGPPLAPERHGRPPEADHTAATAPSGAKGVRQATVIRLTQSTGPCCPS